MHFVFKDFCLFTVHLLPKCYFLSAKHWTPTPSHTAWLSEFTALTLHPRRRIQWRMPAAFHVRQTGNAAVLSGQGSAFSALLLPSAGPGSAAALISLFLPGTKESQPRVQTSLDLRHLPKYADSHTTGFWSATIKGMLRTSHARDFVFQETSTQQRNNLYLKAFSFTWTWSEHEDLLWVPYPTATVKASCGAKNNCQTGCTETICRTLCLWKLKSTMLPRKGWIILFTLIMLSAQQPTIKFGIRW